MFQPSPRLEATASDLGFKYHRAKTEDGILSGRWSLFFPQEKWGPGYKRIPYSQVDVDVVQSRPGNHNHNVPEASEVPFQLSHVKIPWSYLFVLSMRVC